jgi:GNAT superfamily N-acetyltransferase
MDVALRSAGPDDGAHIRWALYTALSWNPERKLPPAEETLQHPEALRYHRGWGRHGDLAVIATAGDDVVGAAYCRLFTQEDHGHGYVDDDTPEVAIGVRDDARGAGLGTRLLEELAAAAAANGFRRLSLSVDAENPAVRLYERVGYRALSSDDAGIRMIRDLV